MIHKKQELLRERGILEGFAIAIVMIIDFTYQFDLGGWKCQSKVYNNIHSENKNGQYETIEFKFSFT